MTEPNLSTFDIKKWFLSAVCFAPFAAVMVILTNISLQAVLPLWHGVTTKGHIVSRSMHELSAFRREDGINKYTRSVVYTFNTGGKNFYGESAIEPSAYDKLLPGTVVPIRHCVRLPYYSLLFLPSVERIDPMFLMFTALWDLFFIVPVGIVYSGPLFWMVGLLFRGQ